MIKDYFKFALGTFSHRRLRSWLTMIGIFIGISAVVALISLGQGMSDAINSQFQKLGVNKIIVLPAGGYTGFLSSSSQLTEDDIDTIKKTRNVVTVAGFLTKTARVEFGNKVTYLMVAGIPTDDKGQQLVIDMHAPIISGRKLKETDKYGAMTTYLLTHSKDYFDKEMKIRDKVKINDREFAIVGELDRVGSRGDDSALWIPLDTARDIFEMKKDVNTIMVETKEGMASTVAEDLKKDLRRARDVKKGEEDFEIQTSEQLMESFNTIFSIVTWVVIGIAAISLLVGAVGITNTMYTAILERTREVGIMKAIGATNVNIFSIFLIESGLLGLIGGVIGILIGMGLGKIVEVIATMAIGTKLVTASFHPLLIIGALTFSFVLGAAAGTLPAMQAAKMKPVDALRK